MVEILGYPFLFGLWIGAFAGALAAAGVFAYLPPAAKTWVARGPRSVLTVRRAPTARERVAYYRPAGQSLLNLPASAIIRDRSSVASGASNDLL